MFDRHTATVHQHFARKCSALFVLLAICILTAGCGGSGKVRGYQIERKDGHPVMSFHKLTVVFENISWKGTDPFVSNHAVHIAAPGETREESDSSSRYVAHGEDELSIKEWWSNGVTTISFNEYKFHLIEDGTKLKFGDKTFAVAEKQTIVVAEDGTASVKAD